MNGYVKEGAGEQEERGVVDSNTAIAAATGAESNAAAPARVYKVGTLRYTRAGLVALFLWLLWGDFCSNLFQNIFGNFLPLFLHHLKASNALIAFLSTGISGWVNLLFLPNISAASDRCRSRWGRRIPFLFWSTPIAALALIGLGYSPELGGWLHGTVGPLRAISLVGLTLTIAGAFVMMYSLFLMTSGNVYQYLVRDVVPQEAMVWFFSLFRVVGIGAIFLFQWFLFRYIVDQPRMLCVGVGLIYAVSFVMICWGVKEGRYPPPRPRPRHNLILGELKTYMRYFRECLSVGIYRNYIFVSILQIAGSMATAPFAVLFAMKSLRIDASDYGRILAWATLASGIISLPTAYLCKRFHPMRVALASVILMALGPAAIFFFAWNRTGLLACSIAMAFPSVGWFIGGTAVNMLLFPAGEFGKFSSSLMAIGWGSLALTSYLIGAFMNFFAGNYRMGFLASLVCYAAAIVPMYAVYRGWKSHGGPDNYIPPLPAVDGR